MKKLHLRALARDILRRATIDCNLPGLPVIFAPVLPVQMPRRRNMADSSQEWNSERTRSSPNWPDQTLWAKNGKTQSIRWLVRFTAGPVFAA